RNIRELLTSQFPEITFPEPTFNFTPTIDIDNAYAYKYKGFLKNGIKLTTDLFTFNFKNFSDRIKVLARIKEDPYDSYEKQAEIHEKYNLTPIYFFLLGNGSAYDRNLSPKNPYLRKLI